MSVSITQCWTTGCEASRSLPTVLVLPQSFQHTSAYTVHLSNGAGVYTDPILELIAVDRENTSLFHRIIWALQIIVD